MARCSALAALACLSLVAAVMAVAPVPAGAAPAINVSGFDTCGAPSLGDMTAWYHASPYRSLGIYVGGANRACPDGNLSASWVSAVEGQGWVLAPLYVGLQAPCNNQGGLATIDPPLATSEGVSGADDAVSRALFFGITPGNPIYFDMEAYGNDAGCISTVQNFLSAWVGELHARGYLGAVYGSSASTIHDQAVTPYPNHMDDVWFANWNGTPNIFGDPYFSDSAWPNNQRLHQYQGGHYETWGGVPINIDNDIDDGAVAGLPAGCTSAGWGQSPRAPTRTAATSPTAGPAWSDYSKVTPPPPSGWTGAPAVASWAPGRLDVFARGGDGVLYSMTSLDGGVTFGAWYGLGSPPAGMTCSPTAVSWGAGRIDVFVRGADGGLWQRDFNGTTWEGWTGLGGILLSSPAVSSWAPGRLDIMAVGIDHAMYHMWYDGGWHGWEPRGGYCLGDPGVISWGPGRIDLFTLGVGHALHHQWFDGAVWWPWAAEVPGAWLSGVAASSWGPGRIDLFLESAATGNALGHVWYWGGWYSESQGGNLTAAPTAVSRGYPRIDIFVRGTDANLYHKWYG